MTKTLPRPISPRIDLQDKARLAVARALDRQEELELSWISRNVLGRNHAYLFQYLFKGTPRVLDYGDAIKLAGFLKIAPDVFSSGIKLSPALAEHLYPDSFESPEESTVPVYGPSKRDASAIQVAAQGEIGRAPRHPAQRGMKDAFAIYAVGESMMPRYRPGELVYAVADKPPVAGQDCIVELRGGEGYLVEFRRRAAAKVIGAQHHPAKERVWPAKDVKAIHAVVARG